MRDYIELEDGSKVELRDLVSRVPYTCFLTPAHIEICTRLARLCLLPPTEHIVYVNLLFVHGWHAKELSALLLLTARRELKVRRVVMRTPIETLRDLLDPTVQVTQAHPVRKSFLRYRRYAWQFVKIASHRLFRLFRKRNVQANTVIRAYVDSVDGAYPELIQQTLLLIYPFKISLRRQRKYLRLCWSQNRNVSLVGFPYRFFDYWRLILGCFRRDLTLVKMETIVHCRHAQDFLAMKAERIYCDSESETAGTALHGELRAAGIRSINSSHGIGVYGPHVDFNEFVCFNRQQQRYYARFGRVDQFKSKQLDNLPAAIPPRQSPFQPVVVFLHGNWKRVGKLYESDFQDRALAVVSRALQELKIPFAFKPHPNSGSSWKQTIPPDQSIQIIKNLAELGDRPLIFLNLMSTSFYGNLAIGPTIFLGDDLIDPTQLFGPQIEASNLAQLPNQLSALLDQTNWRSYWSNQITRERDSRNLEN